MRSRILNKKSTSEINKFLSDRRVMYSTDIKELLNCSIATAKRIVKEIKQKYHIETHVIRVDDFKRYLYDL